MVAEAFVSLIFLLLLETDNSVTVHCYLGALAILGAFDYVRDLLVDTLFYISDRIIIAMFCLF